MNHTIGQLAAQTGSLLRAHRVNARTGTYRGQSTALRIAAPEAIGLHPA
jgi:hypothetical protein